VAATTSGSPGRQPVVQSAEYGHGGHLAGDLVRLPHLGCDWWRLVVTERIGVVAAIHHDAA